MLRLDRYDVPTTPRPQIPGFHRRVLLGIASLAAALAVSGSLTALGAPDRKAVERGKYLVTLGGCTDCHTPGYFFGKPETARFLGGSEVGFEIPGLGIFHGPNLTPDDESGLGTWSEQDIVTALQTGKRPDGRELAPIMPWRALANLTPADAKAIAAYLKSLPPVKNKVPGPFGPNERSPSFVMKVVAPGSTATK
jgi:mono/diheme cytochrome c family protein